MGRFERVGTGGRGRREFSALRGRFGFWNLGLWADRGPTLLGPTIPMWQQPPYYFAYIREAKKPLEKEKTCELSEVGKDSTNGARMEVSTAGN